MKATSLPALSILVALASVCVGSANAGAIPPSGVNVADFVAADGKSDAADVQTGVRLKGNGNFLTNLHPLYTNPKNQYADSYGFRDSGCNNSYNRCYSDHFSTGWFFGAKAKCSYMDGCFCFWYAKTPGARQTAIRSRNFSRYYTKPCTRQQAASAIYTGTAGGVTPFLRMMLPYFAVSPDMTTA